jgi:outer membrane protein OmpA-like peptidoglycan-associated protein
MKMQKAIAATAIATLPLTMAAKCDEPCCEMPSPITIAATATSAEPAPSVRVLTDELVTYAKTARHKGDATVTIVTATTKVTVDLTPMRGKAVERIPDKATTKIEENLDKLEETVNGITATKAGLDAVAAWDRAVAVTPAGGQIYLLTSGQSTVAPTDLRRAGGWIANPKGFVQRTRAADLPNSENRHLIVVGLGYAAGKQPSAGPAARTALTTIYLGLCQKAHAASCQAIDQPVSESPTKATKPVPVVSLTEVPTACVASQITIENSVAFQPGSAHLAKGANKILRPIVTLLQQCPVGRKVTVTGYSARTPSSTGPATQLERNRARAVRHRLLELGVPNRVLGKAKAGGQLVNNMPGGQYSEQLARQNRVVVLTIR